MQPLSPATPFPGSTPPQPSAPRSLGGGELDPELLALPAPPRRERTLTLVLLLLTAIACLAMATALRRDAGYLWGSRAPADVGDLASFDPATSSVTRGGGGATRVGSFVKASGLLGASAAIRYERAFVSDSFRVQPALGRRDLFVELRVPAGQESPRYVPPTSFTGRLVRLDSVGVRHRGLAGAIEAKTGVRPADGAYLLIDGEEPDGARGTFALLVLFVGFGLWNLLAMARIVRPAR